MPYIRSKFRTFALAAALVAIAAGALASHAGAITASSASVLLAPNSQNSLSVSCAPGQRALAGGVTTNTTFNKAALVGTRLDDGDDANTKLDDGWIGFLDTGATGAESITTHAICQGGKVASKLKYRERDAVVDPTSSKKKVVRCPDGYKATGGGVTGEGTYNATSVTSTRPVDHGTTWEGRVRNISGSDKPMTVYAICATGRFARDLVRRATSGFTNPGGAATGTAECPAGSKVTGGGALLKEPTANLVTTFPGSDSSWRARVDAPGPAAEIKTYAVCKT